MHDHDAIDRVSPMIEPLGPVVMTQSWDHLLFLHWSVPVADLQALIPADLTIDTFDGKAYVAIVPFQVRDLRPAFTPPVPGLSSFAEVNVRTYVHRRGADPGVWFFSLDASSAIVAASARTVYRLPYRHAEIAFRADEAQEPACSVDLQLRDGEAISPAYAHLAWKADEGRVGTPAAGSLASFLLNRYVLYSEDQHMLYRARIHHAPPRVQGATVNKVDETLIWAAGVRRGEAAPLAHYVRSVESVRVYLPELCRA